MHHLFHERKCTGHRPSRSARLAGKLCAAVSLVLASAGCNIVQGFQEAGDTLFPQQSTHLSEPGVRLVSQGYRELGFAVGSDIYLLARGGDDTKDDLFSMRYADPQPCAIPNVGYYIATRSHARNPPLIAYFHERVSRGMLHFADANCKTFDLQFDDAQPVSETDTKVVISSGTDLWLASPETSAREVIATHYQYTLRGVFGQGYAVRTDDELLLFDGEWQKLGAFGDGVTFVQQAGKTLFFGDKAGLHRLTLTRAGEGSDELLASDACGFGMQDSTWATFRSPCSAGPVIAVHEPTGKQYTLPFEADPRQLRLIPARSSSGLDPTRDPFWFIGMRNGEGLPGNTLVVKPPHDPEFTLGDRATLQQLRVVETEDEAHGYALVDVSGDTGRYLWWNSAGESKELAQHVLARPGRLIVDFDGTLGKVAVTSGDRLLVLAEGVSWSSFEYKDASRQWTGLFHDWDVGSQNGALSVFYGTIDGLQATPVDQPFELPTLEPIAPRVGVYYSSPLNDVLSGVIYLADFDPMTKTGRLEYRNLELRFTAVINRGVSDYIVTEDQVLYAVPRGEHAGIWLSSGK